MLKTIWGSHLASPDFYLQECHHQKITQHVFGKFCVPVNAALRSIHINKKERKKTKKRT